MAGKLTKGKQKSGCYLKTGCILECVLYKQALGSCRWKNFNVRCWMLDVGCSNWKRSEGSTAGRAKEPK